MEIITGVERRRRWRLEEKLRIVAEVEEPGASFVAVARRHEVSRGLLWNWRRQVRRGDLAPAPMPVHLGAGVPHPGLELCDQRRDVDLAQRRALRGGHADHGALDRKDRIDPAHGRDGERRMGDLGKFEQLASAMGPAAGLDHRPGLAVGAAEIGKPGLGIGLEYAGIGGQVAPRMLSGAVRRVEEHRSRRRGSGRWPVIAHVGPQSPCRCAAAGQHRHRGVIRAVARPP